MNHFILFLHVLGAAGMGFFMILPLLTARIAKLSPEGQKGYVSGLYTAGRTGQFLLILQFLTGGYLISQGDYTALWMIIVLVLFLAIAAMTGIAAGRMKKFIRQGKENGDSHLAKVRLFSQLAGLCYLLMLIFMVYPMYKG